MSNFIEKYRLVIGIVLISIIVLGVGVLFWQKQSGKIKSNNPELANLEKENQDLKDRIAKLESSSTKTTNNTDSGVVKSAESVSTKININTADEKALDTLAGIGPAKAKAIISYRESHGGFKTTQDIIKVSGIGQSTFEKIKDQIIVE